MEDIRFILTGEISLVYTQDGKGRRVHLLMFVPSFEVVKKINSYLDKKGRRDYDGRPIFNISCIDFVKDMKEISDDIEIIPAHCWTPWFGVFGSKSGFNSLKEAFGEQENKIYAIETGMSNPPETVSVNVPLVKSISSASGYCQNAIQAVVTKTFSGFKDNNNSKSTLGL